MANKYLAYPPEGPSLNPVPFFGSFWFSLTSLPNTYLPSHSVLQASHRRLVLSMEAYVLQLCREMDERLILHIDGEKKSKGGGGDRTREGHQIGMQVSTYWCFFDLLFSLFSLPNFIAYQFSSFY